MQTALEGMLILAFNAGWHSRDNQSKNGLTVEIARHETIPRLLAMIEDVDAGELGIQSLSAVLNGTPKPK